MTISVAEKPITVQNEKELTQLSQLEQVIDKDQKGWYSTGAALSKIRDQDLYLPQYQDFDTYCRKRWDFSRRRANQLISAAALKDLLLKNNCTRIPENEAQIRPLTSLTQEDQEKVWQKVIEIARERNCTITAKLIKEIAVEFREKTETASQKVAITKEAKQIYEALSVLSEMEVGKIREAILSNPGESLKMSQLVQKVIANFSNLELQSEA